MNGHAVLYKDVGDDGVADGAWVGAGVGATGVDEDEDDAAAAGGCVADGGGGAGAVKAIATPSTFTALVRVSAIPCMASPPNSR